MRDSQCDSALIDEHIIEVKSLVHALDGDIVAESIQSRNKPHPSSYVGKGKLEEIVNLVKQHHIDMILCNDELTPTQMKNIEKATNTKVIDRSGLILDIFAMRAKTSVAKTQVELAQLIYVLPRLTRLWKHLSRQKGGIGTKGPGETQIEIDRRKIYARISLLKQRLEKIKKRKHTQSYNRNNFFRLSLVGYTNSGKSTLMQQLTKVKTFTKNMPFSTLDTKSSAMYIGSKKCILSDTVGFIRHLPHHLIESFAATLDEINQADILLHVVDISTKNKHEHIEVVNETLKSIHVKLPIVMVMNKIDCVTNEELVYTKQLYPKVQFISAAKNIGIESLKAHLATIYHKWVQQRIHSYSKEMKT